MVACSYVDTLVSYFPCCVLGTPHHITVKKSRASRAGGVLPIYEISGHYRLLGGYRNALLGFRELGSVSMNRASPAQPATLLREDLVDGHSELAVDRQFGGNFTSCTYYTVKRFGLDQGQRLGGGGGWQ